jgi:hypothetical protein
MTRLARQVKHALEADAVLRRMARQSVAGSPVRGSCRTQRKRRRALNALALIGTLVISASAFAQCQYEAIAIPETCNGGWTPWGVNDHSAVVGLQAGCSSANWKPFLWTAETGTNYLPIPPDQGLIEAVGVRVANDGTIAGYAKKSNSLNNLIVWRPDGTVKVYFMEGADPNVNNVAIRFDGAILGEFSAEGFLNAFILKDDELLPLPPLLVRDHGGFKSVNRSGWATGRHYVTTSLNDHPIFWDGESDAIPLDLPAGYSRGYGEDIDCFARIAGEFRQTISRQVPNPAWHAYVWEAGSYTMIPLLPGFTWSTISGMNDAGQIVGECSKPLSPRAYFYQYGTTTLLSSLITPPLPFSDILTGTYDINELGEITTKTASQMYLLRPIGVVPADVDINCRVDVNDLSYVLRCWGPVGPTTALRADVNGDGWVDAADLAEVLGAWTP